MLVLVSCSLQFLLLAQFAAASPNFGGIFQTASQCPADDDEEWGYRDKKAPMYWGEKYPACYGKNQSPIDIDTNDAVKDENLAQLEMKNYSIPIATAKFENNGHSVKLTPLDDVQRTINVKGSIYTFQHCHLHWGATYDTGSEHTVDGKQYAMELHLVHTNENGEIAVVGVFFQENEKNNTDLQKLMDVLSNLQYKGDEVKVEDVNLNKVLPKNPASFYRYDGSLTTPGCAEGVTWSVLKDPLLVGRKQLKELRNIYSTKKEDAKDGCKITENYRPTQPMNNRKVCISQ